MFELVSWHSLLGSLSAIAGLALNMFDIFIRTNKVNKI